jgi:hypothetical protein
MHDELKRQILEAAGNAITELYNLDIHLSKCYTGNHTPADLELHRVRMECLKPAMDLLRTDVILSKGVS